MTTDFDILINDNMNRLESLLPVEDIRQKAILDFKRRGLPTEKMENWKDFSLKDIYNKEFIFDPENIRQADETFSEAGLESSNDRIAFNNGSCTDIMMLKTLPNGIIFGSVRAAFADNKELVIKHLNLLNDHENGMTALNSAFMNDGLFIFVPKGIKAELPLSFFENLNGSSRGMSFLRNLIIVENDSQLTIHHKSSSSVSDNQLGVNVTEMFLGTNSVVEWNTFQQFKGETNVLNFEYASIEENSKLIRNIITIGSYNARNEISVKLNGTEAFADINGAYILKKEEKLENRVFMDHVSPDCESSQLFKGILNDKSNGAFTGKILVRKDSQRTNAFQSTKNILLSDEAKISMNPFLEIYADDVKCSHGASIGTVDKDSLFYLRARGISKKEAEKILLKSFLLDIIGKVSDSVFYDYLCDQVVLSLN